MTLADLLPWVSTIIALCITIGGLFAMRAGYSRQATEIQERVIDALKAQNEAQETQILSCEKEISRLKRVVATIQYALKRRGLQIEIDGDAITLIDSSSNNRSIQILMKDVDQVAPPDKTP